MVNRKKKSVVVFVAIASLILAASIVSLAVFFYRNQDVSIFIKTKYRNPDASILFLSSLENSYSYALQEQALREVCVGGIPDINLDTEYFEPDAFYLSNLKDLFYNRVTFLENRTSYDLVVVSGLNASLFVEKYRDELFPGIPVIFFCIRSNSRAEQLATSDDGYYVFYENYFMSDLMEVAADVFPNATNYVAIYDRSDSGWENYEQFEKESERLSGTGKKFFKHNSSLMTRQKLWEKMESYDPNDTVVFYMGASTDSDGNTYSVEEQVMFIADITQAPIFSYNSYGVGLGILGGMMIDQTQAGKEVGELALRILDGEEDIPKLHHFTKANYIFDYAETLARGLKTSQYPPKSGVVNIHYYVQEARELLFLGILGACIAVFIFAFIIIDMASLEMRRSHELRRANSRMEYMLEYDSLTNLPNRFKTRRIFDDIQNTKDEFALMIFDIDEFKNINDFYSHHCGDEVLRVISKRALSLSFQNDLYIAKFGADEFFGIYTKGHLDFDSPVLKKLTAIFDEPIVYNDNKIYVKASFGIVNSRPESFDNLVADADIALNRAKTNGKNKIVFFDDAMKEKIRENNRISKIIDDAIVNDGVTVVYQPQIDLATEEIHGYEALMRLKNQKVSPAQFIPIAEETGQIIKLDRILTEKVVQQMAEWRDHGVPLYKVSINYSYNQVSDIHYVDFLEGLLKKYDIPPELICIEITESLFISNKDAVLRLLDQFKKRGISLALDDFGTGYSSLSYLTFLPIDTVKVDKSLVDNYLEDGRSDFIRNIVRLVHSLHMKLTVEGVEHKWQNEKLKSFQCDYIQGYFYSKPISGQEIEDFNQAFRVG